MIYIDYFKARPYLVDRNKYIEKYTRRTYNMFGETLHSTYNAPDVLVNIEGSYIEAKNLLNIVDYPNKFIVNKFLISLKNLKNGSNKPVEFRWKRN